MSLGSITKLVTALVIIISVTFLAFYGKIAEQAVTALLGAVIGYILGNGQAVVQSNKIMGDEINKALLHDKLK